MTEDHDLLGEPLGPSRPHVVLGQDLEHARAGQAGHQGGRVRGERHRGEDEVRPALEARGREPAERDAEEEDEHDPEPEVRERLAEHGHDRARVVVARPLTDGGDDPRGDAEQHGEGHGREREIDGGGQPLDDHPERGGAVLEGLAEVAAEHAPEEDRVLDVERLAETELAIQRLDRGLRRPFGQEHLGGVAGQNAQDHEDEDGRPQEGEGGLREASREVGTHERRAPPGGRGGSGRPAAPAAPYLMATSLRRT